MADSVLAIPQTIDIRPDPRQRDRYVVDLAVVFNCDIEQARRFKEAVTGLGLVEIVTPPHEKLEAK